MMKIFVGVAILAVVAFVSGANAFPKPEPESSQSQMTIGNRYIFSGVVEKIDAKEYVVVVKGTMLKENILLTFDVNDKTMIRRGKMVLHIEELKRLMDVRVEYKQERDKLTALTINIIDR